MDSLTSQANSFGLMVVAGLVVGLCFDIYRALRGRAFSKGAVLTIMGDLAYCFTAAVVIYAFLIVGSWGELRFYLLAGVIVGLLFYFVVFSKTTLRFLIWGLHAFSWGGRLIGTGVRNAVYQSLNFGVKLGHKSGVDRLVRKGRVKVGALQDKVGQLIPKVRIQASRVPGSSSRKEPGRKHLQRKPNMSRRVGRTARRISARSRNFVRRLGLGFRAKG